MELSEKTVKLIKLADGTLIDPSTREPLKLFNKDTPKIEAPDEGDEDEELDEEVPDTLDVVPAARRSIMDLTLTASQMAVVNNVLVYTLWGLPDDEIAMQCNCGIHQVAVIRDLEEYKRMHGALVDGLREAYSRTVQGIIHDAAPKAARGIVKKMKNKSQDISMAAMKDLLDRSGHRPADRVEHTHMHQIGNGSELVIRIMRESDQQAIPTLELSPNA